MKRRFGREMVWMTLPVVVLGGVGWWRTRLKPSEDLTSGAPRLLLPKWKRENLTPREAALGYGVLIRTTVQQAGRPPLTPLMKRYASASASARDLRVVYKNGNEWKVATPPAKRAFYTNMLSGSTGGKGFAATSDLALRVKLGHVPRDAGEVRLRGRLIIQNLYLTPKGAPPPPRAWKFSGTTTAKQSVWALDTLSPPFDVLVKRKGEPFPGAQVSRVVPLQLREARWVRNGSYESFQLFLKRRPIGPHADEEPRFSVDEVELLDGDGRQFNVFNRRGDKGVGLQLSSWLLRDRNSVGSALAKDEHLVSADEYWKPRSGWDKLKRPLTLKAWASDHGSWPLKINVKLKEIDARPGLASR